MRTWDDYKNHVKSLSEKERCNMENIENLAELTVPSRKSKAQRGNKMKTLKEFKAEQMKDPDFASAYMELEPEMNIIRAVADARITQHHNQKE